MDQLMMPIYHKESTIFKKYASYGSKLMVNLNYGKYVDIIFKISSSQRHTREAILRKVQDLRCRGWHRQA